MIVISKIVPGFHQMQIQIFVPSTAKANDANLSLLKLD